MNKIGQYTLDSLQIFFPWDDDFYTYMKKNGFGSNKNHKKALPLVYADNCASTMGQEKLKRKFVLRPEYFGETYSTLGWEQTKKNSEPIIQSEKPEVLINLDGNDMIFKFLPNINGNEQYHIEYSSRAEYGKMYGKWSIMYLSYETFSDLVNSIAKIFNGEQIEIQIKTEKKKDQREEIHYVGVPITYYEFSLGEFKYAAKYVNKNGFSQNKIPSLVYDPTDQSCTKCMSPIAKVGILHTTGDEGFEKRNPQFVIKISQDLISTSGRGKNAKVKGIIRHANNENKFILDAMTFTSAVSKLNQIISKDGISRQSKLI